MSKNNNDRPDINNEVYLKSWYFSFNQNWQEYASVHKGNIPSDKQLAYLDELRLRLHNNNNNDDKQILIGKDLSKFWADTAKSLQYINDDIIVQDRDFQKISDKKNFSIGTKYMLLRLKNGDFNYQYTDDDIIVRTPNNVLVQKASTSQTYISMMDYDYINQRLIITGNTTFPFENNKTKLYISYSGQTHELKDSGIYSEEQMFGEKTSRRFPFKATIDLSDAPRNFKISFLLKSGRTSVPTTLIFYRNMSKLSGRFTYWHFGKKYLSYTDGCSIFVTRYNLLKHSWHELLTTLKILRNKKPQLLIVRTLYWLTKPVYGRRKIWLFSDKIYAGLDNAEYLYRYIINQNDGIHKYYVLKKDTADAKRLNDMGIKFLDFSSVKCKLLFLHADAIFFTHTDAPAFFRYPGETGQYFRGLFRYDLFNVQHGLIVQDMRLRLNQSFDNLKLFFVASHFETKNLLAPGYGYDKSQIIHSGLPRLDYRKNDDQRSILITPSWRNYIAPPQYGVNARSHTDRFKHTAYFKIYDSLINNKKLIDCARDHNYQITFLLHPVTASQIDDFNQDGYVKIISSTVTGYEKLLAQSSLMVTDYSGVQFDFAYMNKPIVYFHPPELPPSYRETAYSYQKHSLGEITTTVDQLVDTLCKYIKSGCAIEAKYKKRIDNFFYHHDLNNCKRIYDTAIKWQCDRDSHDV